MSKRNVAAREESPAAGARGAAAREVSLATHHVMQANKSKDTRPELKVRAALCAAGLRGYRLHWKKAPGKPDICYPGRRTAIFVNGCFWHHCPYCDLPLPRSNAAFWEAKFLRNRIRDERSCAQLLASGWTVAVVWECRLKKDRFESTMSELVDVVQGAGRDGRAAGAGGRLVVVGSMAPWKLRVSREYLSATRARIRHRSSMQ